MSAEPVVRHHAVEEPPAAGSPRATVSSTTPTPILPFEVRIDLVDRMLNFEIADDPCYSGLEIQVFDDDVHGQGTLVFLSRRDDGRIDVYRQPGLAVDPSGYGIGGGLGVWAETEISPDQLIIDDLGVRAHVRLTDVAGRVIEVRVDDRGPRRRRSASMLAPMGAGIEHPTSLPLVWMRRFDLLRWSDEPPVIRIDGRRVSPGRLPAGWLHRRHLIKYAADLCVVSVNPAYDGAPGPADPATPKRLQMARSDGAGGTAAVTAAEGTHVACLRLTPPLPDLTALGPAASAHGAWDLDIDGNRTVTGGTWHVRRRQGDVLALLDVTRPWRPKRLPPLMWLVTKVMPLFRTWPTTYRWTATIALDGTSAMCSRWERRDGQRGRAYRRMTGSA